jgi:hypothetical protein
MEPFSYYVMRRLISLQKATDFTSRIQRLLSGMIHVLHECPNGKQPNVPVTDWQLALCIGLYCNHKIQQVVAKNCDNRIITTSVLLTHNTVQQIALHYYQIVYITIPR